MKDNAVAEALERLAALATPELFTVSSKQMSDLLRRGAEHQRPRARNWEQADYGIDGELLATLVNNFPTIIAALKAQRVDEGGVS